MEATTTPPVLLVTCSRCERLHAPACFDLSHPVCGACQARIRGVPALPLPAPRD